MHQSSQRNLVGAGEVLPSLHRASDTSETIQSVLGSPLALCQLCVPQRWDPGASFFEFLGSTEWLQAGLAVFKDSFDEQAQASKEFIPT